MSMLEHTLTTVEQLHRATEELRTDHPTNNRLALILIDNAVELIVHHHCMDRLKKNEWWSRVAMAKQAIGRTRPPGSDNSDLDAISDTPVMTEKQQRAAKGKHLDQKLKLLASVGDIAALERRFVTMAHDYRNELYHVGLAHNEIIRPIAGQYFRLSCDLFTRLGNLGSWTLGGSPREIRTEIAKLYLPTEDGGPMWFRVDKEEVAGRLRRTLPDEIPNLSKSLEESAETHIIKAKEDFDYMDGENPLGLHDSELLEFIQWEYELQEELERQNVDGVWWDPEYLRNVLRVEGELRPTWTQRHTSLPIEGWFRQADRIGQTDDPIVAMHLYGLLMENMSYISDVIKASAESLDKWQQDELDRIRGK